MTDDQLVIMSKKCILNQSTINMSFLLDRTGKFLFIHLNKFNFSRFSTHNSAAFRNDGVVLNGGRERFIPIQREDGGVHRLSRQPEWQPSYPTYNEESSRGVVITENPMFSNY